MSRLRTVIATKYGFLGGDKLYQLRARQTLPYLVRQAKAGQTISYSELASELNYKNPRSFNYILGAIGNSLLELSNLHYIEIPPIQCIVVNKNTRLPGEGLEGFLNTDFSNLTKRQQEILIDMQLAKVYTFNQWDWILSLLGLEPLVEDLQVELDKAKNILGGGESEDHRKFKEWISKNPQAIGLKGTLSNGETEYKLPSGDSIDILFMDKDLLIAVEVKSKISKKEDILRGLFQCIKYKKVLEAKQII